ncbi:MAG TPA: cupredoxin domain-containing protein [Anaerolineae bacterium]
MSRRLIVVLAAIALMAVLLAACGGGASGGGTGGGGSPLNVSVTATEFKFDPATINATPGQTINLTVKNNGSVQHTWVQKDSNVSLTVDPGKTATKTFTAPSKAGTYVVECDIAGHKEAGMVGQLVVK